MARFMSTCPVCGKQYENTDTGFRAWCSVGCQFGEEREVSDCNHDKIFLRDTIGCAKCGHELTLEQLPPCPALTADRDAWKERCIEAEGRAAEMLARYAGARVVVDKTFDLDARIARIETNAASIERMQLVVLMIQAKYNETLARAARAEAERDEWKKRGEYNSIWMQDARVQLTRALCAESSWKTRAERAEALVREGREAAEAILRRFGDEYEGRLATLEDWLARAPESEGTK